MEDGLVVSGGTPGIWECPPRLDSMSRIVIIRWRGPATSFGNIIGFGIESPIGRTLNQSESQSVLELVHELQVSNILMPAADRANTGWPWLSLTSHGKELLNNSGPPVYDYEGYLADLNKRIPGCDPVIVKYVSESLRAFQFNLHYASMVMLGCASEKAISLLIEAYINSIDKEANQNKLRSRIVGKDISTAYDEFKKSFDSTKVRIKLSQPINDFDTHVDSVFTFIRLLRNSIVHPGALPQITSAMTYSNLQHFSYYVETVFKLIEHYRTNQTIV